MIFVESSPSFGDALVAAQWAIVKEEVFTCLTCVKDLSS
jgi:hypothetical protein